MIVKFVDDDVYDDAENDYDDDYYYFYYFYHYYQYYSIQLARYVIAVMVFQLLVCIQVDF